ncbi:MAG: GHMP kinase [Saprospiraceae bacterium]|nr:GHMP kinase [Saprospiraceae bacterium]
MLTGEYAALDGALTVALPTKKGQKMTVKAHRGTDLVWQSYDHEGKLWFESEISIYDFSAVKTTDPEVSERLKKYLKNAVRLNCEFLDKWNAFKIETFLEFPRDWGLGSSSTLIHLIAEWAEINPLELYFKCENGSGYDVACAGAKGPIEYISSDDEISYTPLDFKPAFADQLFFVHLGNKQSSDDAIKTYLTAVKDKKNLVKTITEISEQVCEVKDFTTFNKLMDAHEEVIAKHTGFKRVKEVRFSDFSGSIKSLGAWGGDFILATGEKDYVHSYFNAKGLPSVVPYKEMVL